MAKLRSLRTDEASHDELELLDGVACFGPGLARDLLAQTPLGYRGVGDVHALSRRLQRQTLAGIKRQVQIVARHCSRNDLLLTFSF